MKQFRTLPLSIFFILTSLCCCIFSCLTSSKTDQFPQSIKDQFSLEYSNQEIRKADIYRWSKEFKSAIYTYKKILREKHSLSKHEKIYILNQLIYCSYKIHSSSNIENWLSQIENLDVKNINSTSLLADFLFNKAQFLISKNHGKEALSYLHQAEELYKKNYNKIHLKHLEVLTLLGKTYFYFSDQYDVIEIVADYLEQASVQISTDNKLRAFGKEYFYWKGFVSFMQRKPVEGLVNAEQAIRLAESNREFIDTAFIAQCKSVLGILHKSTEKKQETSKTSLASNLSHEAVKMAEEYGKDTVALQFVYQNLLTYLTRIPDSIYFYSYLDKLKQLNPEYHHTSPNRLEALWHFKRKNFDRSIKLYQKVIHQLDNRKILYNRYKLYDESYFVLGNMFTEKSLLDSTVFYEMKNLTLGTSFYQKETYDWEDIINPKIKQNRLHSFVEYGHLATTFAKSYKTGTSNLSPLKKAHQLFLITDTLIFNYAIMADKDASLNFLSQIVARHYPNAINTMYQLYQKTGSEGYMAQANFFMERMKSFLMYQDMILKKNHGKNNFQIPQKHLDTEIQLQTELKKWKWILDHPQDSQEKRIGWNKNPNLLN